MKALGFWLGTLAVAAVISCGPGVDAAEVERPGSGLRRAPFEAVQLLSGELAAERAEFLSVPATSAWNLQLRWLEQDGIAVAAGARVAELDAGQLLSQVEEQRATHLQAIDELERVRAEQQGRLEEGELALARAQAALARARLDAEVPAELLTARDATERGLALERARAGLEKAERDLEARRVTARSEIGVRELALRRANAELTAGEATLDRLIVKAPAAGILILADHPWEGRKLQPGDQVWPGFPLASLPDLATLYLVADLSDVDEGRVLAGMPARAILDAFPDEVLPAVVRSVAAMAREIDRRAQRRAFRVVADLERIDGERFRPGMSVRLEVVVDRRDDALLAPRTAIDFTSAPPRLAAARGWLDVALGPCDASDCVILSGVDAGAVPAAPADGGPR